MKTLHENTFPDYDVHALQDDINLGRLRVTNQERLTDPECLDQGEEAPAPCVYEQLFTFGGRSFSIWSSHGDLGFDIGDDFGQITATALSEDRALVILHSTTFPTFNSGGMSEGLKRPPQESPSHTNRTWSRCAIVASINTRFTETSTCTASLLSLVMAQSAASLTSTPQIYLCSEPDKHARQSNCALTCWYSLQVVSTWREYQQS